jgi:hypothetical protein
MEFMGKVSSCEGMMEVEDMRDAAYEHRFETEGDARNMGTSCLVSRTSSTLHLRLDMESPAVQLYR